MTRNALNLACEFYSNPKLRVSDIRPTKLIDFSSITSRFQVNIRLYEPVNQLAWRLVFWEAPDTSIASSIANNIDIGLYEGHCFYIKELNILTNHWESVECQQRFTHHDSCGRQVAKNRCTAGQPKLVCPGKRLKHIMNASEKVFYGGNTQLSWKACRWIECQSELIGQHIHHALCGHEGERCIIINKQEILVDRFDSKSPSVNQFYGGKWHGCPCTTTNDRVEHRNHQTMDVDNQVRDLGYNVVSVWESSFPELSTHQLNQGFNAYLHCIVYDFEAVLVKKDLIVISNLTTNSSHIPISVAINDKKANFLAQLRPRTARL